VAPAERIVCVAADGQVLPKLPNEVRVVRDLYPQAGPLGGLATGLKAMGADVQAVFVCGCDSPLLVPAFVRRMFELLGDRQIAVPRDGEQLHPLAAAYRSDVLQVAEALLAEGERSLRALVARCDSRVVDVEELRDVDPELLSIVGCNTEEEYRALLARVAT
jgi:molybdopterin-guanine dinucleotide biosynthesis protein A